MTECSHDQVTQSKAQQGGKVTEDRHLVIFAGVNREHSQVKQMSIPQSGTYVRGLFHLIFIHLLQNKGQ